MQPNENGLESSAEEEWPQRVPLSDTGGADAEDGAVRGVDGGGFTVTPAEETFEAWGAVVKAVEDRPPANGVLVRVRVRV